MHVTAKDLAAKTGRHRSTMILGLRRWQNEVGKQHTRLARAGGRHKRLLLTPKDAAEFLTWYRDDPR
jgi:hypothetical protein